MQYRRFSASCHTTYPLQHRIRSLICFKIGGPNRLRSSLLGVSSEQSGAFIFQVAAAAPLADMGASPFAAAMASPFLSSKCQPTQNAFKTQCTNVLPDAAFGSGTLVGEAVPKLNFSSLGGWLEGESRRSSLRKFARARHSVRKQVAPRFKNGPLFKWQFLKHWPVSHAANEMPDIT